MTRYFSTFCSIFFVLLSAARNWL